jgi:hypothetical protein
VNTVVNESRYLKSLAHGVEFVGCAHVAQERGDDGGITQSSERVNQLIEAGRRLGFGVRGNYLA